MHKILSIIIAFGTIAIAHAQKTELRVVLNSGLFSFTGNAVKAVSFVNYNEQSRLGYTNNPYGSESELCFGLSANVKRVTAKNFIFGADLGYEVLRSKVRIDKIYGYDGNSLYNYSATGQAVLNFEGINLHPFLGYRVAYQQVNLDFMGGIDAAYCVSVKEIGHATASNGTVYEIAADRKTILGEIRPRLQVAAEYKKIGVYIGYSLGLADYKSGILGGVGDASARLLRFGLTYQIR